MCRVTSQGESRRVSRVLGPGAWAVVSVRREKSSVEDKVMVKDSRREECSLVQKL